MNIGVRALRNETKRVLELVEQGEAVTITVAGRPVAELRAPNDPSPWIPRSVFIDRIRGHQADPALKRDLALLAPETTDDLAL